MGKRAVLATLALTLAGAGGERPWPPGVKTVPAASPALSPDAALSTFLLPPGYRVELVASEPMVEDPVWVDQDPEGRLWVVEMRGFMPNAAGEGERDPVGRVVVLEDVDDDGKADRSTVFMDGLVLPRSVKVLDKGVLVAEPPHLWLVRDEDGDLRADSKVEVRNDYGRADGNPEHNANALVWGLDNWIYTSEHDGHLRLKDGRFEHRPTLFRGQWGASIDDAGRLYRNWNEVPLYVDLLPARYLARNPNLVRTRGVYEKLTEDLSVWPARPTPGVNRGYRKGILRPDGSVSVFVAAGTPVVYRGDRLPRELQGDVFVTEPAGNLVRRLRVSEDTEGRLTARNAYERAEFLASTDERFRPVNLLSAADGTLYVVDMYRGIIQHGAYQSEYLKHHIRTRQLDRPIRLGRIYRIVHETTVRERRPALSRAPSAALVALLAHPNGWRRDTAQRLLVERGDRSVAEELRGLFRSAPDFRARLHALWTLDGLEATDAATVEAALADASPHVRASAIRLAERWLAEPDHPLVAAVMGRLEDGDPLVRRQLAASLGELHVSRRDAAILRVVERHGHDPVVVDAAVSGLRGREAAVLDGLLRLPGADADGRLADAVAMLAGAALRVDDPQDAQALLSRFDAERPEGQRLALLRGFDAAIGGEAVPGRAPVGRGRTIALSRRPEALVGLAESGSGEAARLAARVVSALDWPGKARRAEEDVPPLTAAEEARYRAGEKVYKSLCAACHQADGRGRPGMGPPLAGSAWALGRAGLAARIVVGGKEGDTLMPPLASLSDDEVASVLTFVRRAWGNTASAVDASLVREVRGASTGRSRPWTEAELAQVTQPDGPPPGDR